MDLAINETGTKSGTLRACQRQGAEGAHRASKQSFSGWGTLEGRYRGGNGEERFGSLSVPWQANLKENPSYERFLKDRIGSPRLILESTRSANENERSTNRIRHEQKGNNMKTDRNRS